MGLGLSCYGIAEELSFEVLMRFFSVKTIGGVYYLSPRLKFKVAVPSKVSHWQNRYFFLRAEGQPRYEWGIGTLVDPKIKPLGHMEELLSSLGEILSISYTEDDRSI
ncbi:hypothetical protein, partial [Escherichia coli]|uniref:hypothetical protein n=1 Tax=Escherichia coli TaxID=562 RepID=UPI0030790C58